MEDKKLRERIEESIELYERWKRDAENKKQPNITVENGLLGVQYIIDNEKNNGRIQMLDLIICDLKHVLKEDLKKTPKK